MLRILNQGNESKKSKTFEIETKSNNNSSNDGNNSNGNHRKRRSISRESSCDSQYSCDSGSCSCEHHSSMNEDDGDDDDNVGDDGKEEIDRHRDGKIKDRDRKIDVKNGVRSTIHSKHNAIDYEDDEDEKDGDDADENGHHHKDKTYRRASPARSNHSSYRSYTRSPNCMFYLNPKRFFIQSCHNSEYFFLSSFFIILNQSKNQNQ